MKRLAMALLAVLMVFSAMGASAEMEIQEFPASGDMYEMLDLSDPYKTVISGLFRQDITQDGLERECYVYIGAENRQMQPNVTIIPDSGADVVSFLEQSGWKDIADEQGLILMIAVPEEGGWDPAKDLAYMNGLWTQTHVRYWYNCQKHNSYMLAYGDGATLGQMWGMQAVSPQKLVSFATFGDFEVDASFVEETSAQATRLEGVTVGEIEMPVWFFVTGMNDAHEAVLNHWNAANDVGDEVLMSETATAIYSARTNSIDSLINEQAFLAQTRYTVTEDAAGWNNPERTREVWSFLSSVIRPVGYANNQLRAYRSVEDWGATKQTLEVDGVNRYWVEFVPEKLIETEDGKAPLVVMFHGNNQGAETFLANSDAIKLANERGFIMILMTGALYNDDTQMPNPMWNLNAEDNKFDDYAYVRAAIEDVASRLPVDESRIYAMGLSYGSMATQSFVAAMSDIFAAGAPVSGLYNSSRSVVGPEHLPEGTLMPIFLINGATEADTEYESESMRERFGGWLVSNGLGDDFDAALTGFNKVGRYSIWTFANEAGVPLVQYSTAEERIHTVVLDDLFIQYDSFLSKYSRGEDGTLYYMGEAVK
ncbi:MAG: PHB depolymerase family esterase [Clostridia bacterium]|nr:PHB depolymerase family esterase [Clostridia bacterium]